MSGSELSLSGTSVEFDSIEAGSLNVTGAAILAEGGSIGGGISVGAAGLLDFAGTLLAGGGALAANAVLAGSGALVAGNADDPGMLTGPGTLLAAGGDSLFLAAGSLSGGLNLQVEGGGVLVLGAAAVNVDRSVTLDFSAGYGVAPLVGGYADSLAEDGGVIVIADPQGFDGAITGFAPGDRLVFPGLTDLTLSDITSQSFAVTGTNSANQVQNFTLHAAIPLGSTLALSADAQGDAQIGLATAGAELYLGGSAFTDARINAGAGVGQRLLGLQLLLPDWASQSLTLSLSVGEGDLAYGTVAPAPSLVLTAASPAGLNSLLGEIIYTANLSAAADTLTATGGAGLLAGFSSSVAIMVVSGGTVSGFTASPTAEQTAVFAGPGSGAALVTQAAAPGAIRISGAADFADVLAVSGIGGTALSIDGGGSGIFDAGAQVTLAGDAVVGDAGGAGTLGIITSTFVIGTPGASADLVLGGASAAAGSVAEITGGLQVMGDILLGQSAAATLRVSGALQASDTTIGAAGLLTADGGATLALGGLVDAGALALRDVTQATAQALLLAGQLTLGGTSTLSGLSSAVIATGGSLSIGQDAELSAFGLNAVGGSVFDQGTLLVAGDLQANAGVTLAGGILHAAAVSLGADAVLAGFGSLVADGAGSGLVLTGGEILASGGTLALDGNVTMRGGASIVIAGSAALDLLQGASGGTISFAAAGAILAMDDLAADSSAVAGMLAGDVIDLPGVAPSLVSDAEGTISVTDGGTFLGGFGLSVAAMQPGVSIVSDGDGGALITLGGEMACFVRGTRLLTPNGYVPVEEFKPGDPVITQLGIRRAVRWIGRRGAETSPRVRHDQRPVLILPGAMGPAMPSRPVRLSPSHAIFLDGVRVPVMHLVNGVTIRREPRAAVGYFHIELDRHDVLIAEGLPVESYLDTGNRGEFQQELGVRGRATQACAPLVTGGPQLARMRRRLHEVLVHAGFKVGAAPNLRAVAGDAMIEPRMLHRGALQAARFDLPPNTTRLVLLANSAAPAETDPDSDDRRELSICLRQPRARRQRLTLGAGWYPKASGDAGIWMSASGEVLLPAEAGDLTLTLQAVVQSWRRPVDLGKAGD